MSIFNMESEQLSKLNATYTATEINQQPATWVKTINQIKEMKEEIKKFVDQVLLDDDYDIIFTGAGTSEFVGNSLFSQVNVKHNYRVHSYASTDITAMPKNYISPNKKTLLISFGRSGNSPESIGAVESSEAVSDKIYNLFITCNSDGALSKMAKTKENCFAINLTSETHDLSFAMTSSFTNMYLSAYLALNLDNLDEISKSFETSINSALEINKDGFNYFKQLTDSYDYSRIVYLGSNVLKGIAQESALKMLELTAGKVVTLYDTALGFRHGPKSIVNNETLTVIYLSDDNYTRKYEIDLVAEMSLQRKGNKLLVVCNTPSEKAKELADFYYCLNGTAKNNIELGPVFVVCAQLLALFKSLSLNLTPDNPWPTGEVNRVVKGVTLYPYAEEN